ncbi:Arm DNA-binding domain-containing protein [Bacillus velezensis]|uniref:Arm DNA-binding domain-containing protein n=1 Tax=Bacillus velezensis TaxID=492670 RepID=UPI00311AAC8F
MASFLKRGKTWQYCVSAKPKPIRKGGFPTKKEAMIAAAEVEAKLSKGIAPGVDISTPFDEYFERWVKLYRSRLKGPTLSHYAYTLQEIRKYFGSMPIQKIKRHDYQEFLNNYGQQKDRKALKNYIRILKPVLRMLLKKVLSK